MKGLHFTFFLFYSWAADIHSILLGWEGYYGLSVWVPAWEGMEIDFCRPISLMTILCSSLTSPLNLSTINPILKDFLVSDSYTFWFTVSICLQPYLYNPLQTHRFYKPLISPLHWWIPCSVPDIMIKDLFVNDDFPTALTELPSS